MCGGEGEGEGEVVEQQIRALGNPYSSFSSSSSLLCIRRGFDEKFHSRQCRTFNNTDDVIVWNMENTVGYRVPVL